MDPAAPGPAPRDRGAAIPLVALLLPVLILMTAFAVDLGRQRSTRRTMQANADVIALDMVRLADGRTEVQILADPGYAAYLAGSADRNDIPVAQLTIEWGTWDVASGFVPTLDTGVPNAVEITATETIDYFFQPGTGSATRTAIATTEAKATGQIGSGLVTVDSTASATVDAVLRRAFGINSSAALGILNYNGLAGATIDIDELAAQLGFGSVDELVGAQVSARNLLLASATVLRNQGDEGAAQVFDWFGTSIDGSTMIDMGQLFQFEQGGSSGAAGGGIDAFGLLTGSAYVINGTNTISVPTVTTGIAGLTSTSMSMNVTQGPIQWGTRVGDFVDTQQVDLRLSSQVDLPIDVLGLTNARITGTIPVQVQVAGSRGVIVDIDCSALPGITLGADGRPVTVQTGLDLDVWSRVLFVSQVVATVDTTAGLSPSAGSSSVRFDHPTEFLPPDGTGGMVHAPGTSIDLAQALTLSGSQITALGVIPLDLGALSAAINAALEPVLDELSTWSLQIAAQLGVDVGGSDLAAVNMTCDQVKLVG